MQMDRTIFFVSEKSELKLLQNIEELHFQYITIRNI